MELKDSLEPVDRFVLDAPATVPIGCGHAHQIPVQAGTFIASFVVYYAEGGKLDLFFFRRGKPVGF